MHDWMGERHGSKSFQDKCLEKTISKHQGGQKSFRRLLPQKLLNTKKVCFWSLVQIERKYTTKLLGKKKGDLGGEKYRGVG